jgi:hypothetical protein
LKRFDRPVCLQAILSFTAATPIAPAPRKSPAFMLASAGLRVSDSIAASGSRVFVSYGDGQAPAAFDRW